MSESKREQEQLQELIEIMAAGIGYDELGTMLAARKLYLEAAALRKAPIAMPQKCSSAQVEKLSLSIDEAATAVGISRRALFKCLSDGDLPSFKLGNNQLIMASELTRWLNKKAGLEKED